MLELTDLHLSYGAAPALRGISLKALAGEVTCVLGRNGVGKTSLMRAVVGRLPIASGRVTFEGRELSSLRAWQRVRGGIAVVPQGREIFPLLTVRENLQAAFAGLPGTERHVPDHVFELFPMLKEMLGRRGGDLSGGQQQQLAIARALVTRPRLLMLDEPTEGIQPSIIKDIGRAIAFLRERGDMAIVLVEQYFDFANALADRYYVLDRGEVVVAGVRGEVDPEEVRRHLTV